MCTVQWHKYPHYAVQPSAPPIAKTFSSSPTETWSPLNTTLHSLLPAAPGTHYSTFYLSEFDCFGYLITVESYSVCPFGSGLFHWAYGLKAHTCVACQDLLPFSGWVVHHCVQASHFVYPSSLDRHADCAHLLTFGNSPALTFSYWTRSLFFPSSCWFSYSVSSLALRKNTLSSLPKWHFGVLFQHEVL